MVKKKVIFGRIIKISKGVGYRTIFETKEEAEKYREMNEFILKNDNYDVEKK